MQSQLEESVNDALWRELSPQLDEAMAGLGASERDALVLRYFQNKSMAEVGKFLGLAETTAQKRVSRALEKLRKYFTKRGVSSTTAILAGVISVNSVQAVPATLAKSVTAVALAKGATASTSTLTLIKGALKIMACTKMKATIVAGVVALLVAGTTPIVIHHFREFSWTHELSSDEVSQYSNRTGTTPEQVTKTFFDACGHEDWTAVSTFWEAGGYPLDDRFKSHYGGLQIINLGRPFWARFRNGERYPGVLVPYEIRLQDGKISKGRLAIRCDNPDNRWYFDGGM